MADDSGHVEKPRDPPLSGQKLVAERLQQPVLLPFDLSFLAFVATGSAYIFSYFWLKSFLAFFLIDISVAQVDLQTVIVAGSSFLGGIAFLWTSIALLPAAIFSIAFGLLFSFLATFMALLIFIPTFSFNGFNWVTVILGGFASSLFLAELTFLIRRVRKEKGFLRALKSGIQAEANFYSGTVDHKIAGLIGNKHLNISILVVVIPFAAGNISGDYFARGKQEFMAVELQGSRYFLVHSQSNFALLAEMRAIGRDRTFELTGKVRRVEITRLNDSDLELVSRVEVVKSAKAHRWVSLFEFLNRVRGVSVEDRR